VKNEPERHSRIGLIALLGAVAFAAAALLNLGGFGRRLDAFFRFPITPEHAPPAAPALPPPVLAEALTQAWFLDAPGYDGAEAEQKRTGAPLLVFFHKRACEPCRRVEHELLASPEMKHFLEGAVRVRVDVGAGAREDLLAQKLQVATLPALVAISPTGALHPITLQRGGLLLSPAQVVAQLP